MSEVKRYHVTETGLVEGESLGRLSVVLAADFDRVTAERDAALGREAALLEELEMARDDLVIFKSAVSALGEASKKLVFCARTSGGTAGPDQGLMDACAGVEGVITLGGIARAMNEFERLTAERDDLSARLEQARDRKNSIVDMQQRLTAADERNDNRDSEIFAQVQSALRRSFSLGQIYWQQADSDSTCQQNKSDQTMETQEQHILNVLKSVGAALKPAEAPRNQCDGCQAGIPLINGTHRMGREGGYPDFMGCSAKLYKPAEGVGDDTTLEEDREDFKKVFVRINTKQGQSISLADMIARYEKKP